MVEVVGSGLSPNQIMKPLAAGAAFALLVAATSPAVADSPAADAGKPPDATTDGTASADNPVESSVILLAAPERAPWYTDKVGDALVGGGIILGVTAALFYRAAINDRDAADTVLGYGRYDDLVAESQTEQNYAIGFAVGATALVAAGVVSYIVRDRKTETPTVIAGATQQGGWISWFARF